MSPPRPAAPGASQGAHLSYFSMVRSSTPPVRNRIWPAVVDLPASTCPMNTMFRCSLHPASTRAGRRCQQPQLARVMGWRGVAWCAGSVKSGGPQTARLMSPPTRTEAPQPGDATGCPPGHLHRPGPSTTAPLPLPAPSRSSPPPPRPQRARLGSSWLISSSVFFTSSIRAARCSSVSAAAASSPPARLTRFTSLAAASPGEVGPARGCSGGQSAGSARWASEPCRVGLLGWQPGLPTQSCAPAGQLPMQHEPKQALPCYPGVRSPLSASAATAGAGSSASGAAGGGCCSCGSSAAGAAAGASSAACCTGSGCGGGGGALGAAGAAGWAGAKPGAKLLAPGLNENVAAEGLKANDGLGACTGRAASWAERWGAVLCKPCRGSLVWGHRRGLRPRTWGRDHDTPASSGAARVLPPAGARPSPPRSPWAQLLLHQDCSREERCEAHMWRGRQAAPDRRNVRETSPALATARRAPSPQAASADGWQVRQDAPSRSVCRSLQGVLAIKGCGGL